MLDEAKEWYHTIKDVLLEINYSKMKPGPLYSLTFNIPIMTFKITAGYLWKLSLFWCLAACSSQLHKEGTE